VGGGTRDAVRAELRDAARGAWTAALLAVDPAGAVRGALARELAAPRADTALTDPRRPIVVLGMGKAGVPMLRGAMDVVGDRVRDGLVVVKDGHAEGLDRIGPVRIRDSAHPIPDARAPRLGEELLDLAGSCAARDLALVLVSGGGSALVACPIDGVTLADLRQLTGLLLASGEDIHAINRIRGGLTRLGWGRLARAIQPAPSVSLVLSDVIGDRLESIASGPTTPPPLAVHEAVAHVAASCSDATLRDRLVHALRRDPPTGDLAPVHRHVVVASCAQAVDAAAGALRARFHVESAGAEIQGDARAAAVAHVSRLEALARAHPHRLIALVGGGETTVELPPGAPPGGRNQHFAACAAEDLDRRARAGSGPETLVAAIATDGTDGTTDAAGGCVDAGTIGRVRHAGADPDALLEAFDSHRLLQLADDLVVTGPTGTNVMDLHLGLAAPAGDVLNT
jgi:hydroxypyruvate reductase